MSLRSSRTLDCVWQAAVVLMLLTWILYWTSTSQKVSIGVGTTDVEAALQCSDLKISILSLTEYATPDQDCKLDNLVVDERNGIVYGREFLPNLRGKSHQYSTHAQAWYLQQALRDSSVFSPDPEIADVVLVDDYCFYMRWLAHVHSVGSRVKRTPGDVLVSLYKKLIASERWQRHLGSDFVFVDGHTGFASGGAAALYDHMVCNEFRRGIHLVTDKSMRNVCGREEGEWPWQRTLVIPYVPGNLNASVSLVDTISGSGTPLEQRDTLVFHQATCTNVSTLPSEQAPGKNMRRHFATLYKDEAGFEVTCVDAARKEGGTDWLSFSELIAAMARSVFCLVLPGDGSSTRRLSEIFMAGCIPVFVGPPFHSMPLIDDVDYSDAIIVLNITNHTAWMPIPMEASFTAQSIAETDARFWFLDKLPELVVTVEDASSIPEVLRSVPQEVKLQKLARMAGMHGLLSYTETLTVPPNAVSVALEGICRRFMKELRN